MPLRNLEVLAILDSLLEGFQVVDREFRYVLVNDAAAAHGRSTKQSLLGRTMMECYPGIEGTEMFAALRRCLEDGTPHTMENPFTFPDGSVGFFELRIQPAPQGASVLSVDVSARRNAELALAQAEERLRHAQRMEAVGQLAAGLAHDFNNLLTVMLVEGEHALAQPAGAHTENVESMMAAARTSAELTRQLLAYGRRTVLHREIVDVAEVLLGLEPILRPALGARLALRLDAPARVGCVEADRSQLEQIVMNLVLNARDSIPEEGRVSVSVSTVVLDEEYAASHPGATAGPHVVLTVADTGGGMDEATTRRVFEPFFTTKARGSGTGLGLATVYGIVKQHGGNVWVYSELGEGTTFKIYLPASDCARLPAAAGRAGTDRPVAAVPAGGTHTVLVAEDAPVLRRLVESILGTGGFRVLLAASGEEALAHWEREEDAIALVITDAMMPGMSGAELIARLRARRADLPVICTSGYTDGDLAERGALPGGVSFVEKPFSPRVLLQRVRDMLA